MSETQKLTMNGLPFVPMDPNWLSESPAFLSDNPAVVRATFKLLAYAWQAVPAGSVPTDFRALSNVTGLSERDVADSYEELFAGWTLRDGRLHFDKMTSLCERITSRFGEVLSNISDQAAAVIQSPEDFSLVSPEVAASPKKGKRHMPKNWTVSEKLRTWLFTQGIKEQVDIDFIALKFTTHFQPKGIMMIDWDGAFQNFVLKEDKRNLPSSRASSNILPIAGGYSSSRSARFGSAGVAASAHNENAMSQARMRREAQSG